MADGLTAGSSRIELRAATPGDRDVLVAIYRSTREDELALTGWDDAQKNAFIEMQFAAQDQSYHEAHPEGHFDLIVADDQPVGRLYVGRLDGDLRIIDLAILPEYRGAGIGSAVLARVLAEADAAGVAVGLHVEPWNPAKRLYERLGFVVLEQRSFYEFMERPATTQLKTAS